MNFKQIMDSGLEVLGAVFTVRDLLIFLVSIIVFLKLFCGVLRSWFSRESRLFRNLKRPIMVLGSSGKDMKFETDILSGFFNVKGEPSKDLRRLDTLKNHALIIASYTRGETDLNRIFTSAKNSKIPVIVYASQNDIDSQGKDMRLIRDYYLAEIANSPMRMVNLIFSILSTYKND